MESKITLISLLVIFSVIIAESEAVRHKKIIIHVPVKVKKHHHTVVKPVHVHHKPTIIKEEKHYKTEVHKPVEVHEIHKPVEVHHQEYHHPKPVEVHHQEYHHSKPVYQEEISHEHLHHHYKHTHPDISDSSSNDYSSGDGGSSYQFASSHP